MLRRRRRRPNFLLLGPKETPGCCGRGVPPVLRRGQGGRRHRRRRGHPVREVPRVLQVAVGALVAAQLCDAVVGGRRGEGRAESGGRETGSRRQTDSATTSRASPWGPRARSGGLPYVRNEVGREVAVKVERRVVAATIVVLLSPGVVLGANCALPPIPEFPDYLSSSAAAAAAFGHGDDDDDDALITVCPPG